MMESAPLSAWSDHLEQTAWPRGSVAVYAETASTQDICRGREPGFVCVAERQTTGRGRLGRKWEAPPGKTLSFSFVAPAGLSHGILSLAVPVAICRALDPWLAPLGLAPKVKWPNDVYADGKKLAGVLIEVENGLPIVGIGLNVLTQALDFLEDLRLRTASLASLGASVDRLTVLAALLRELDRMLLELGTKPNTVVDEWKSLCLPLPSAFHCEGKTFTGTVLDVDADKGLVLRLNSGEITHLPAQWTSAAI